MKKKIQLFFTIILSIIHIHFSAYTVENIPNPLFWVTFLSSGIHSLDEKWMYFIGGIIIQSIFTIIIANLLIGYKNVLGWSSVLLSIVSVTCMFHVNFIFEVADFSRKSLGHLYKLYELFWGQPTLPAVLVFSAYQMLLLLLYKPVCLIYEKIGINYDNHCLHKIINLNAISRQNLKDMLCFYLVYCGANLILTSIIYYNDEDYNNLFSVLSWQICFFFAPINAVVLYVMKRIRLFSRILESIGFGMLYSCVPTATSYLLEKLFYIEDIGSGNLRLIVFVFMNIFILLIVKRK